MSDAVISLTQLEDKLKQLVAKYHAQAAYLFGSYARGEAHPDSDLDVLIVADQISMLLTVRHRRRASSLFPKAC